MKLKSYMSLPSILWFSGLTLAVWNPLMPVCAYASEIGSQTVESSVQVAQQLSDRDPLIRQNAAESVAREASVEHRRLLEGYRLQEKNPRVRLALEWALYRTGKNEALFGVVKDLDSSRQAQAIGYLEQLESPEPLYVFLGKAQKETLIGILEVFARIGDSETLTVVRRYKDFFLPEVSRAATLAESQILLRLEQTSNGSKSRPRRAAEAPTEPNPE
jgi:hypothetical protein